jgi:hypothetical protein
MKTRYFKEPNGDYLCINPDSRAGTSYEGRATCVAELVGSISTTSISDEFLRDCKEVTKEQVPKEWMDQFRGYEDE